MVVFIRTTKLAKVLNADAELRRVYGAANARVIRLRLAVLRAVANLAEVPSVPPDRRHALAGEYRGHFAVDARHPFRIVLHPCGPDGVRLSARRSLSPRRVTHIMIVDIVDYH